MRVPASAPRLALVIGNAGYVKLCQRQGRASDRRKTPAAWLRRHQKLDRNLKGMTDDRAQDQRDTVSVLYCAGHGRPRGLHPREAGRGTALLARQ
jgi:hypothetical protein